MAAIYSEMTLQEKIAKRAELRAVAAPLVAWLNENFSSGYQIDITRDGAKFPAEDHFS
jgi:hypothetical protein